MNACSSRMTETRHLIPPEPPEPIFSPGVGRVLVALLVSFVLLMLGGLVLSAVAGDDLFCGFRGVNAYRCTDSHGGE